VVAGVASFIRWSRGSRVYQPSTTPAMAFWGVEVKPGKPYTHTYQADHGRLRVCQATLSNCDASGRTVLQCNVGNKIPIKLCSLNPKLAEMCHLEIELEEVDDVVFSVIGQSSIHLSGYYVRASSRSNAGDDESYPSQSIMPYYLTFQTVKSFLTL